MGNNTGKEIRVVATSNPDTMINALVELVELNARLPDMSDEDACKVTATIHSYHGEDATLHKLVAKQEAIADLIKHRIGACRARQTALIRQRAKVLAHFNDGDGDDITFTMEKGLCNVVVNGRALAVKLLVAEPSLVEFEYTSGSNRWIWTVDFQTRTCKGRSPRSFLDKRLESTLTNDSVVAL